MTARPVFVKFAAFFFAFAAAVALVGVFTKLLPDRPTRHYAPAAPRPFELSKDLGFDVGLVTLDRENARSHTRLNLHVDRRPHTPDKLWVRTLFFSPDDATGRIWGGEAVELTPTFDEYGYATVTVTATCGWCDDEDAPRGGYFARVQIGDGNEETSLPLWPLFRDIQTAAPVVVHADRASSRRR